MSTVETGINPAISALTRLSNTLWVSTIQNMAFMHPRSPGFVAEGEKWLLRIKDFFGNVLLGCQHVKSHFIQGVCKTCLWGSSLIDYKQHYQHPQAMLMG